MTDRTAAPTREARMRDAEDEGAAAERLRQRKWLGLIGLCLAAGAATAVAVEATREAGVPGGMIPSWVAIGIAIVFLIISVGGTYAMVRITDEVEIHNNVWGFAAGSAALFVVYPVWCALWRGGLVPEPTHFALFAIAAVVSFLAYLWMKYR